MSDADTEKWVIPTKWRWDETNPDFEELVRVNEAQQKRWAERANLPFASLTAREIEMGRAVIIAHGQGNPLERAEAWAALGRYDKAMELDPRPATGYAETWEAITNPQTWCGHGIGPQQKGISPQFKERDVFNIRTNSFAHLVKCSVCGHRQVGPLPKHLARQEERRNQFQSLVAAGMDPHKALAQINGN